MNISLCKLKYGFMKMLTVVFLIGVFVTMPAMGKENILDLRPSIQSTKVKGIKEYSDEEFKSAPVRITVFSATWCSYCKELKDTLPGILYSRFDEKDVAIRIWEIDYEEVVEYFNEFADKNQITYALRGQVPFIFINEQYPYLGYSEEIADKLVKDVESILKGEEPKYKGNIEEESIQAEGNVVRYSIVRNKNKISYLLGGILDGVKFLLITALIIACLYFLKKYKLNTFSTVLVFFLGLVIDNIINLIIKPAFLLDEVFVGSLRMMLYIILCVAIFETIISFFQGKPKRITKKTIESKVLYIISFFLGMVAMNSQIYNRNSYYSLVEIAINKGLRPIENIINILLYSLGLILINGIYILIINRVKYIFIKRSKKHININK